MLCDLCSLQDPGVVVFSLPLDRQICVVVFLSCFDIDITALGSLCVKNKVYDFTISAFFHFFLSVQALFIVAPHTLPQTSILGT